MTPLASGSSAALRSSGSLVCFKLLFGDKALVSHKQILRNLLVAIPIWFDRALPFKRLKFFWSHQITGFTFHSLGVGFSS